MEVTLRWFRVSLIETRALLLEILCISFKVIPMDEFNLHLTGDIHAITAGGK